ncbi:hypothetical protein N474_17130 [Pseudoalteromonas luteoviolacea CPMOR-2]|uniref:hypothetical protein n=1 Tax=Pseudoalteromonas luteoviolacea TaxID=43657 RepID=UPI0007B0BEE4|nr:hypothetical protein [Pseudoalteromonas luteoviolacea]KZN54925.1 hypothetical protein N474_17130 [Pseudoalteromonas luteoviolacea CPMOR-2]
MNKTWTIGLALMSTSVIAEFEQAYAPIVVSDITIFIPIELKPEQPSQFWQTSIDGGYNLAWSPADQAQYYEIVYQYKSASGQLLTDTIKVNATNYILKPKGSLSGAIQVRSCHKYGCSGFKYSQTQVPTRLELNAFTGKLVSPQVAQIAWNASGATYVSVTEKENGRVLFTTNGLSPRSGTKNINIYPGQHKSVTLTAVGFGGQRVSRTVNIAGNFVDLTRQKGTKHTQYLQPFYEKNYSIVERSVLYTDSSVYFATQDFKLYRFDKSTLNNYQTEPTWVLNTDGLIANNPVIQNDNLYYTASFTPRKTINGVKHEKEYSGQVCSVDIAAYVQSPKAVCNQFEANVVAGPVLVHSAQPSLRNAFHIFSNSPATSAQNGLYVFSRDGKVSILDPLDINNQIDSRTINTQGLGQGILATPEVYLADNANEQNQFVIKGEQKIMGVSVPSTSDTPSSFSKAASSLMRSVSFSVSDDKQSMTGQEGVPLPVIWEKEL